MIKTIRYRYIMIRNSILVSGTLVDPVL